MLTNIAKYARCFKLAYLSYLRTNKAVGHREYADNLRLLCDVYNEYKKTYDVERWLRDIKEECRKAIDDETQQLSLLDVV